MSPKISIIVPCYNVSEFLDRCMDSLVNQTIDGLEIILVDDKSQDSTPQICDKWSQLANTEGCRTYPRIKVIHKKINEGLGLARNSGLELAEGEYVAFPDSDDFVDPDSYETLYGLAKKYNCDAVFGEFNTDNYPGFHAIGYKPGLYEGKLQLERIMLDLIGSEPGYNSDVKFQVSACKAIYRRNLIESQKLRFISERVIISEDLIWNLCFLKDAERVFVSDKRFYHYCLNENSVTHAFNPHRFERIKQMDSYLESYEDCFTDKELFRLRLSRTVLFHLRTAVLSKIGESGNSYSKCMIDLEKIVSEEKHSHLLHTYPFAQMPIRYRLFFGLLRKKQFSLLYLMRFIHDILS